MPDYGTLLDDEVRAFLARTEEFYPPDAVGMSIAEQRAAYDAMCTAFDYGYPAGVSAEDRSFGGVPCRVYSAAEPVEGTIFFCHGGGFVVGGLESHDSICAEICGGTGLRVVAVDYRLSPEHPHPDDFNDAWAAFEAVCATFGGPIVMCGDSAGGNLVAAVTHHARGRIEGRISGQVLIYPGLGGDWSWPSYVRHSEAPGLTKDDMKFYMQIRSQGTDKSKDPTYSPLGDTDYSGLPPTVIITAECDPLSSDGEVYAERLRAAGGAAVWIEEPGLVHAYLRARHVSEKAGASFARILRALDGLRLGAIPQDLVPTR